MQSGVFYSKGKFLLSGEYLVLHGAKALAVPLRYGQKMIVEFLPGENLIIWETSVLGQPWFSAKFDPASLEILECSDKKTADFIQKVIFASKEIRQEDLFQNIGCKIITEIEFDIDWGLGSSSSLVSNIAWWFDIDVFKLYRKLYKGSGFDVHCARADRPIVYQLIGDRPDYHEIDFNPSFRDHLFFIYLGKKQDSQQSVSDFSRTYVHDPNLVRQISSITDKMIGTESLVEFMLSMKQHEEILSEVLNMPLTREDRFSDFTGEIKSLGAWGGDFILAASPLGYEDVKQYFSRKKLPVVLRWEEIVYG